MILQFNAHCSGNRLRSIAVRNEKPHSPCVIADYPNLTDCHFGVRRDRLSQKRLSDPSPTPSFVRVARDTDGAWPDASPNRTSGQSQQGKVFRYKPAAFAQAALTPPVYSRIPITRRNSFAWRALFRASRPRPAQLASKTNMLATKLQRSVRRECRHAEGSKRRRPLACIVR
jgi:hypothetical protein